MPGMLGSIEGARGFDEVIEQTEAVRFRNFNDGKPPQEKAIIPPQSTDEFRASVLNALGVGQNVTGSG
ncbi:MAG: hypothetical protein JKX97_08230 [Candidatus Lindowbacteria bacterium]|nr:hypothetical protein [Candidatus Lindowbacteria bacterium]